MKQTAVEWLFLMINNPNKDQEFANKLFEKAKEMEKEQIIESYDVQWVENIKNGKDYYNETFKNK